MKTSKQAIWNNEEIHPWKIIEKTYPEEQNALKETLFSQGNGYLGFRGTFEEGYDGPGHDSMEGTYINGFYEKTPIHYDETAFGYASHTETMLNVPNGKKNQHCAGRGTIQPGDRTDYGLWTEFELSHRHSDPYGNLEISQRERHCS